MINRNLELRNLQTLGDTLLFSQAGILYKIFISIGNNLEHFNFMFSDILKNQRKNIA